MHYIKLHINNNPSLNTNSTTIVKLFPKGNHKNHEFFHTPSNLNLYLLKDKYNTALDYEYLGGDIISSIEKYGEEFTIHLQNFEVDEAAHIINGMYLRSWVFDAYKKKEKIKVITVIVKEPEIIKEFFENNLKKTSDGVLFAKRMTALPPNVLTPQRMVQEIQELFSHEKDVVITVLNKQSLQEKHMNLIYGVSMGSIHEPYVVIIERFTNAKVALIGKGVTFDTGGISLKPSESMKDMKKDMAGAASVVAATYATSSPIITIVGLVENMIGPNAQRVSDIWTAMSGDTVEILNTDAEGRLILADLVTLAQTYNVNEIIDVATLTGAVTIALGKEYGALMTNNERLGDKLMASGKETGDKLWLLPCGEEYNHHLQSDHADIKNVGTKGESGAIAGAKFIEFFLKDKSINWAHMDIAAVVSNHTSLSHEYSNGFGVRLLVNYMHKKCICSSKKINCCQQLPTTL